MVIKIITIKGKRYRIQKSPRKNKKFMVKVGKSTIHFGATGYRIAPGTKKGDRYCARSSGIKGKKKGINSANFWSRKMWECKGKKSIK